MAPSPPRRSEGLRERMQQGLPQAGRPAKEHSLTRHRRWVAWVLPSESCGQGRGESASLRDSPAARVRLRPRHALLQVPVCVCASFPGVHLGPCSLSLRNSQQQQ